MGCVFEVKDRNLQKEGRREKMTGSLGVEGLIRRFLMRREARGI